MMENEMKKIDDAMLDDVNGGVTIVIPEERENYKNGIHPGCGGRILGRNDPLVSCRCERCGAVHADYFGFFRIANAAEPTRANL